MSYWVYLELNTGKDQHVEVYSCNMTSNVAPMWRAAGIDLQECDGKPVSEIIEQLRDAVAAINDPARAAEFEAMNPANGWGSHEGAARFLSDLLAQCEDNPACAMRVSY